MIMHVGSFSARTCQVYKSSEGNKSSLPDYQEDPGQTYMHRAIYLSQGTTLNDQMLLLGWCKVIPNRNNCMFFLVLNYLPVYKICQTLSSACMRSCLHTAQLLPGTTYLFSECSRKKQRMHGFNTGQTLWDCNRWLYKFRRPRGIPVQMDWMFWSSDLKRAQSMQAPNLKQDLFKEKPFQFWENYNSWCFWGIYNSCLVRLGIIGWQWDLKIKNV